MARSYQEMLQLSQNPPDKGFLGNLANAFTKPIRRAFESARYASSDPGTYTPMFESSTPQDIQSAMENPNENVLKTIATVGSFAVPGASGIKGGALTGASAGALGGYGTSEKGDELNDILMGGLTGGAIGGAVGGVSQLLNRGVRADRVASKLNRVADDVDNVAFRKSAGGNAPQHLGGADLEKQAYSLSRQFNRNISSPDDIVAFSDDLFKQFGSKTADDAANLTKQGVTIKTEDVRKVLLNELDQIRQPKLRKPVEKALAEIDATIGGVDEITPLELYALKQEWGKMGKFRPNVPANEEQFSTAMEKVYRQANDVLDDVFKRNGITDFRDTNKILETGIKQRQWAMRNLMKDRATIDTSDPMQDIILAAAGAGGIAGGLPGGIIGGLTGYASRSAATSPQVQRGVASTIRGAASLSSRGIPSASLPARTAPLAGLLGSQMINGYQSTSGQESAQIDPLEVLGGVDGGVEPQVDPQQELAILTLQLAQQTGDLGEASALAELLFTAKYGSMEAQQGPEIASGEFARKALTAQQAGYEALRILESDPSVTGKTQGIENFFNDLTGAANNATTYNQQIETFRTLFMSALGGASLMPAEIERFEKSLPKVTDSPERARQKIEGLLPQLDNLIYKNGGSSEQEDLLQLLGGY